MTYNFRHFLNFVDLPNIGKIEISEPFGFDGSTHSIKQEDKRDGRDIIIADEEIEFEFTREEFEKLNTPQQLINGVTINHASQGYDYILDCLQNDGWESKIEWIIEKDGTQFVKGTFDAFTAVLGNDSIKFKVIQDTKRELVKRRDDILIDAFSDKDLDGNTIDPCITENILLKAKPIFQESEWIENGTMFQGGILGLYNSFGGGSTSIIRRGVNPSNQTVKWGIQNSLSFLDNDQALTVGGVPTSESFSYLYAVNELSNVKVNLTDIEAYTRVIKTESFGATIDTASVTLKFVLQIGNSIDDIDFEYVFYTKSYGNVATTIPIYLPTSFSLDIPYIGRGKRLYIFVKATGSVTASGSGNASYNALCNFSKMKVNITATSTAIDTVIKGVRLIDLLKHNVKSISGLPLNAPIYDVGGEHYNNFAFNGYLLGQITDKPFNNKFKDLMNITNEVNADYQINPDNVEILPYAEYYTNNEMFSALELPDHESTSKFNKKHFLKSIEFSYKKSSSQRETNGENTIDDVHGKTQWVTPARPNRNVTADGNLKIELDHIRSAFLIQEQADRISETSQDKSLQYDENLFLLDVVPLAPSSKGGFSAVLLMRILDNGHLQILNNNSNGDGGAFSWNLLGFGVNDNISITAGENIGTWKVFSISPTTIELFPLTVSADFSGEASLTFEYFFTNVLYTNRTNEGFTNIEGISNPNDYSNLKYSIKRNLINWFPYLATSTKYVQDLFISNTSFEPNGNLITRLSSESADVVDKGDISTTDISTLKILNPLIHSVTVYAGFDEVLQLMIDVRDIKGFIRVRLNSGKIVKGFVKMLEYEWSTQQLKLELEEKYESDYMTVDKVGDVIYVNEVGYSEKTNVSTFRINDIWVQLFDNNDIALNNPIRYTNIKINGVVYTDVIDFSEAMQNLL